MNANLLLIEDNGALREIMRRRLVRRGFTVQMAADGESGYSAALKSPPDLILLDMSLPGKDGWTIAGEIKASTELKAIPLIAITAHAMHGDKEKALHAGCDDYASKPIDFESLIEKIERLTQ
ncbi:MAG: response regulator [Verrucomicrobiota bacterium]